MSCPRGKIRNPKTLNCVLKTSSTGRRIIKNRCYAIGLLYDKDTVSCKPDVESITLDDDDDDFFSTLRFWNIFSNSKTKKLERMKAQHKFIIDHINQSRETRVTNNNPVITRNVTSLLSPDKSWLDHKYSEVDSSNLDDMFSEFDLNKQQDFIYTFSELVAKMISNTYISSNPLLSAPMAKLFEEDYTMLLNILNGISNQSISFTLEDCGKECTLQLMFKKIYDSLRQRDSDKDFNDYHKTDIYNVYLHLLFRFLHKISDSEISTHLVKPSYLKIKLFSNSRRVELSVRSVTVSTLSLSHYWNIMMVNKINSLEHQTIDKSSVITSSKIDSVDSNHVIYVKGKAFLIKDILKKITDDFDNQVIPRDIENNPFELDEIKALFYNIQFNNIKISYLHYIFFIYCPILLTHSEWLPLHTNITPIHKQFEDEINHIDDDVNGSTRVTVFLNKFNLIKNTSSDHWKPKSSKYNGEKTIEDWLSIF